MRHFIFYVSTIFVTLGLPHQVSATKILFHPEPAINTHFSWHTESNGMLTISYDLDNNGKADFFTVRIVRCHFFSKDNLQTVAKNYPGTPVFKVKYGAANHYYLTTRHPLLYALDLNEDGFWDVSRKDISEDGWNGNEEFNELR